MPISKQKRPVKQEEKCDCCKSNNNKILYAVIAIVTVFSLYLFLKINSLEKKIASGAAGGTGGTAAAQKESSISVPNLKKYAKELGLNTGKFNKCLDSDTKKNVVNSEQSYGSSLGVQGTPGFFVNGKFIGGAFPYSSFKEIIDKEISGSDLTTCANFTDESLVRECDETGTDTAKAFKLVPKTVDIGNSPVKGNKNAKVTIVEFSDFECPFCTRAYSTMEQVLKDYKNDVKLVYKQYPLPPTMHPNAQKAAEASLCAGDQGKFWEYHDKLFTLEAQGQ